MQGKSQGGIVINGRSLTHTRPSKARSLVPLPPFPAIPSLVHKEKKALLSISDGRASSFFNTFIKIITPPPFLQAADFRVQRYEEKPRNLEKIRENRRNSEKIRENQRKSEKNQRKFGEKSEKIREKSEKIQRNSEKNGEKWRKT